MDRSTEEDTESLLQKLRERDEELLQAGKYGLFEQICNLFNFNVL